MKNRFHKKDNRIAEILKQRDGATIVFALVVFMIAAVASATIVSVAMTNLKRTAGRRDYEQARLAVMSAAKYLEKNDPKLKEKLDALTAANVGQEWTVSVTDTKANDALGSKIKWTEIANKASMTADISVGDIYSAQVRLSYDAATDEWSISKITKL